MRFPFLVLLGSVFLAACGGGGGGAPASASGATITFPSSGAVTDASSVRVRGTTSGQDAVTSVTVNGTPATSGDGFQTWEAIVGLHPGENQVVVEITDEKGLRRSDAAAVMVKQAGEVLFAPGSVAVEQGGDSWFVADRERAAILRVSADGSSAVVADRDRGQGPPIETTSALVYDFGRGRIYTADDRLGFVLQIDPMTGNREILSNGNNATAAGLSGIFARVTALVHDPANSRLLAADAGSDTVYSIAIPSGDIRLISGGSNANATFQRGGGPNMFEVTGIGLDEPGNRAIVVDDQADRILAVDLSNGNRQVLSSNTSPTQGNGPDFQRPSDIALDPSRRFAFVTDGGNAGACGETALTTLFAQNNGGANGGAVYFNLTVENGIDLNTLDVNTRVDPGTPISATIYMHRTIDDWQMLVGNATSLAGPWDTVATASGTASGVDTPSPMTLAQPLSLAPGRYLLAVVGDFDHSYTNGSGANQSYGDANLSIFCGAASNVPFTGNVFNPRVFNTTLHYEVAGNTTPPSVLRVDLANGMRSTVSGPMNGSGIDFVRPAGLAVDAASNRLVVSDALLGSVVAVELADGNRAAIAGTQAGHGPRLCNPAAAAFDGLRQRLLVVDPEGRTLVGVSSRNGDRSVLAAFGPSSLLQDVAVEEAGDRALVLDRVQGRIWSVDLASGNVEPLALEGEPLVNAESIAVDGAGDRALVACGTSAAPQADRILAVDLANTQPTTASPNVSVLSGPGTGSGPALTRIEDMVVDQANARLLVLNSDQAGGDGQLLAVDLATGDRTLVSGSTQGSGPQLTGIDGIALDAPRSRALITHENGTVLLAADLATGDRTVVADANQGDGPTFRRARELVADGDRAILLDESLRAAISVETFSGDRVISSK